MVALAVLMLACGERGEAERETAARNSDPDAMCPEHGVLQALCTQCDPALIPVFQARGDWCEEHQLPESICPICHPERHGRPAVAVEGAESIPAEGERLMLRSEHSAERAGIQTAEVLARAEPTRIEAPARLVFDARSRAIVNPRAPGVVSAVEVELGMHVAAGARLALLDSAAAGELRGRASAARGRIAAAERAVERATTLREEQIGSERALLDARAELAAARAEAASARTSIRLLGRNAGHSRIALVSPIAGTIVARHVAIGQLVDPDDELFEIVDTRTLWAEIDVPEDAAARLAPGHSVELRLDSLPEARIEARIEYLAAEVDPHTRTVLARASIPNPDGTMRAQMLASASIEVEPAREGVFLPRTAVQHARGHDFVFVPLDIDTYEVRRVRVRARAGQLVEIDGRLRPGERVVTEGAFLLLAEALPNALGAGCCAE